MVCLGNICINTLHKGAKDDDDDDDDDDNDDNNNNNNNNNNNIQIFSSLTVFTSHIRSCAFTVSVQTL
jgi:hypothetical protein